MTFHLIDIWERFLSLPISTTLTAGEAIICGKENNFLLVKGEVGEPVLLMRSGRRTRPRTSIKLKNVNIKFDVAYEIIDSDNGVSNGIFTRFCCAALSSALHRYFIEILVATSSEITEDADESQIDAYVNSILELFRRFSEPPRTTVVGLWGELLVILASSQPDILIDAWHNDPFEEFDFALEKIRLEVKTSEQMMRIHNFALHELRDSRDGDFVASLLIKRSPSGITIFEILHEISKKISDKHYEKLLLLVLETLGEDAEMAELHRFDYSSALGSLVYLPMSLVPSPKVDVEYLDLISNVRFAANITKISEKSGLKNILDY